MAQDETKDAALAALLAEQTAERDALKAELDRTRFDRAWALTCEEYLAGTDGAERAARMVELEQLRARVMPAAHQELIDEFQGSPDKAN